MPPPRGLVPVMNETTGYKIGVDKTRSFLLLRHRCSSPILPCFLKVFVLKVGTLVILTLISLVYNFSSLSHCVIGNSYDI